MPQMASSDQKRVRRKMATAPSACRAGRAANRRGRPFCAAPAELLQQTGFADLSIEAIAADASVGKATVYRWWPNKGALVVDAFASSAEDELHFPDTGSVYKDMSLQMNQFLGILRSRRGRIVSAVIAGGQSDPGLIRGFSRALSAAPAAGGLPDLAARHRTRGTASESGSRSRARHSLRRNLHALSHSPRRTQRRATSRTSAAWC